MSNYISRWQAILIDMHYSLPQEELVRLLSRSCNKHISSILQIQHHSTFEDALVQAKVIEEVRIQGEIKLRKKHNNQKNHSSGGTFNTTPPKTQAMQVTYVINQAQPIMLLAPPPC